MNPYFAALLPTLRTRYAEDSVGMSMSEWIERNTLLAGANFSFEQYPFQRAIADDMSQEIAVPKCSQVGLTEIQIRKALAFCARNSGVVGMFSLPNESLYKKVSQTRIDPLLDTHTVFRDPDDKQSVKSIALKQIGQSFLHIVNATESSATSTSADALFIDEVDLSEQRVLALYSSRLQNSDWAIKQEFSTPTYTGYGIDARYAISTQGEFMCQCESCNHWQVPDFNERSIFMPGLPSSLKLLEITDETLEAIDLTKAYVRCEKCSRPLNLKGKREWVHRYPTKSVKGWYVRPLCTSRLTVQYIVKQMLDYRRRDFVRGWYNTVLGRPYEDSKARLSEAQIRACLGAPIISDEPTNGEPVGVGIDIGQICHCTRAVQTPRGLRVFSMEQVHVDKVLTWVKETKDNYNLVTGAVDRHPYEPTADAIMAESDGKIWPVEYRGKQAIAPVYDKASEDDVITHFQADRTKMIDAAAALIRGRGIIFEGYGELSAQIVEHFQDMVREEEPEKPANWKKLNGNDHFFHAVAFLALAWKLIDAMPVFTKQDVRSTIHMEGVDIRQFPGLMASGFRPLLP